MSLYEEYIVRCDEAIEGAMGPDAVESLVDEIYEVFTREASEDLVRSKFTVDNLPIIRGWLAKRKEDREHELAVAQANAGCVSVSASSEATACATAEVTFSNAMSQVWALPEGTLDSSQKQELAVMLQEFENAKGGSEGKLARAGKAVADWMFDNAIGAIPTVMPYVIRAIQGAVEC